MPAERPDHFSRMRGEEPPKGEPPEGAPAVGPHLIAWLEAQFPIPRPSDWTGLDGAVNLLGITAAAYGQQQVIEYLRTLVRTA